MKVKVTNLLKSVLVIASTQGKQLALGSERGHIFEKHEYAFFSKSCENFKKTGWLKIEQVSEEAVVGKANAEPVDKAIEIAGKEKPVVKKKRGRKPKKKTA